MDIAVRTSAHRMYKLYSMLHPAHRNGRDVAWEMSEATALAFTIEFDMYTAVTDQGPIEWLRSNADNITFLGIKVTLIDTPGIRLVFKVV